MRCRDCQRGFNERTGSVLTGCRCPPTGTVTSSADKVAGRNFRARSGDRRIFLGANGAPNATDHGVNEPHPTLM